jgi:hypothetical protein
MKRRKTELWTGKLRCACARKEAHRYWYWYHSGIGAMFQYVTLDQYPNRSSPDLIGLGVIFLPHWSRMPVFASNSKSNISFYE